MPPPRTRPAAEELRALGFDFEGPDDHWLEAVHEAERQPPPPARPELDSIGSYEVLEEVYRGGQGVVFRARQPHTGRVVALKRLLGGHLASESARKRFTREVRAAACLRHPNIVTVYGMEEVDGLPLLAMEWIAGERVTDWCRGRDFDLDERLLLFLRIVDAVQHAHDHGILHRDLKPSNILVDLDDQPRLLDFGLAKPLDERRSALLDGLTLSSEFLGTPRYAAPEQFRPGRHTLDARADVFSLGMVLFEMLTGESPYGEVDDFRSMLERLEREDLPRASSREPRIDRTMDRILRCALALDPAERYSSVAELAQDIRLYRQGESLRVARTAWWPALRRQWRRRKVPILVAASFLVVAGGFGWYAWWQENRLAHQETEMRALRQRFDEETLRSLFLLNFVPNLLERRGDRNEHYRPERPPLFEDD